jgi:hypothetical protein
VRERASAPSGGVCGCGSERILVRSGTLVRVGLEGSFPRSVDIAPDLFERAEARCAGCGAAGPRGAARALTAAAAAAPPGRTHGMSFADGDGRLPMDEPLCACGSTAVFAVLYGDRISVVRGGEVVGEALSPAADHAGETRWECRFRPYGGCSAPGPAVTGARAAAAGNVPAFLRRLPDLRVGDEPVPAVAWAWPDRPSRVRSDAGPVPLPSVPGMTFIDDAWLERPRGVADAADYVRAGVPPKHLRAVYPRHPLAPRGAGGTRTCGDRFASTWLGAGLRPHEAAAWLATGTWPCCARRWSSAGLRPDEALPWMDAGFQRPADAGLWADEAFGPAEARAWADAGVASPPSARACRDAGLTPREIVRWAWIWGGRQARSPRPGRGPSPAAPHLDELLAWKAAGLGGKEAHRWARAGFVPSEAAQWPSGHPSRPDDVVLAAMAAISR